MYLDWNGIWAIAIFIFILSVALKINIENKEKKDRLVEISKVFIFFGFLISTIMLFDVVTSAAGSEQTQSFLYWIPFILIVIISAALTVLPRHRKT